MLKEQELRQKLIDVLHDDLPLEEFAEWLSSARRNMHRDSSVRAQSLAGEISSHLYQYFGGHLAEDALEEELAALASVVQIEWELAPARRPVGASNLVISQEQQPAVA